MSSVIVVYACGVCCVWCVLRVVCVASGVWRELCVSCVVLCAVLCVAKFVCATTKHVCKCQLHMWGATIRCNTQYTSKCGL